LDRVFLRGLKDNKEKKHIPYHDQFSLFYEGIFAQKEINTIYFSFTFETKKDRKDVWFPLFGPIKLTHISIVDLPLT
jgi:hypothetical protein